MIKIEKGLDNSREISFDCSSVVVMLSSSHRQRRRKQ